MIIFGIKDLYVYIPVKETLYITKARLLQNDTQITHQILSLLRAILSQNYFTCQQKIYHTNKGISMGSPISSLIAEIFLQYEDKQKKTSRHAELSILREVRRHLIFDTKINLHTINTYISNIHSNIKLNPTYEEHSSVDFLDLTILREHKKLKVDIQKTNHYRQFHFQPSHRTKWQHRYHITIMHSLPMDLDKKTKRLGNNTNCS